MLVVEFRRYEQDTPNRSKQTGYRLLQRCTTDAVPGKGELVSVHGSPYRVVERQWAIPSGPSSSLESPRVFVYVYIYVVPWGS